MLALLPPAAVGVSASNVLALCLSPSPTKSRPSSFAALATLLQHPGLKLFGREACIVRSMKYKWWRQMPRRRKTIHSVRHSRQLVHGLEACHSHGEAFAHFQVPRWNLSGKPYLVRGRVTHHEKTLHKTSYYQDIFFLVWIIWENLGKI